MCNVTPFTVEKILPPAGLKPWNARSVGNGIQIIKSVSHLVTEKLRYARGIG